ncbi:M48 family metallopeptidase [Endozoicomonas atrinae]|uniref:M48 family metallopeptidase n=1 Tax=Endozoicomonas atrinae TaxID=1333660 RepID=UPI003B002CD9
MKTFNGTVPLKTPLTIYDLSFRVNVSPKRKTMQITVERDGSLILTLPPEANDQQARDFVREKRRWIYKKLAEKQQLRSDAQQKQFVNGEGFLYLGRSYRLKLVEPSDRQQPLSLTHGRFCLNKEVVDRGNSKETFIRWYATRGKGWLDRKAQEYYRRMEVEPAGIKIQDLGYRWGSCTRSGWLNFHWKTILLPAKMAEYVLVHELAHLHEPNHTAEFWHRVERAMPDYVERKQWIAEHGMEVKGL